MLKKPPSSSSIASSSSDHQSTTTSSSSSSSSSTLPCREKEIEQIKTSLSNCIQLSHPKTMYIAGEPGTGKTACIKQVLHSLEQEQNSQSSTTTTKPATKPSSSFHYIFINAMKLTQPFKAFEIIYEQAIKNSNNRLKTKPKKTQYKQRIENYFKNAKTFTNRPYLIIILDEMDFFVTKTTNNARNTHLLYELIDITRDSNSKLCIIGISNTVSLLDQLNSKIKSRFDETITFYPYENDQIRTIIESKLLSSEQSYQQYFEKSAIKMIGALIARKAGDIRQAIDIIKRCIEIYTTNNNNNGNGGGNGESGNGVEVKKIDSLFVKSIASDFTDRYPIANLSLYHKVFLYCLIQEYEMKLKNLKELNNSNNSNSSSGGGNAGNSLNNELNPNNLLFERIVMRMQNLLTIYENSNSGGSTGGGIMLLNPSLDQLQLIMITLCELGLISIDNDQRERLPVLHFETEYQLLLFNLEQDDEMKPFMKIK